MDKDYYLILGVPLDASPDQIRSAFRKLALRYHPDRRDESGSEPFRDVSEAYDVLSDPARRARYDREQRRGRRNATAVSSRPSVSRWSRESEPLVAEPLRVAAKSHRVRPSLEALFDRLARNFGVPGTPNADPEEPLNYELILSPEEAERGVLVPFRVPVFSVCYACGGRSRNLSFPCGECGGEGRMMDRDAVHVRVPRGVRDGTLIEASLERLGIDNLWLRVHVRVERH